jgi:DNA-binding LacI/PurR family transcriptional regulator
LQALADAAGISKTAASLALRNQPNVSEATRLRVQKLAREMGYRVNPFVSALMASVSRSAEAPSAAPMAFVSDETPADLKRQPRRAVYWQQAERRAAELGYRLERFWLGTDGMRAERLFGVLRARGICGVVFGLIRDGEALAGVDWAEFSCATIDLQTTVPAFHCTESDSFGNALAVFGHLERRGYRRIGLAMDEGSDRRKHYRVLAAHVAHHRMEGRRPLPALEPRRWEPDVVSEWIRKYRPDAVVTVNSEVLEWLRVEGWSIPADIGYANLAVPPTSQVESGMRVDSVALAAGAVDLVDAQLRRNERGVPPKRKRMAVMGNWFDGATLRAEGEAAVAR